VESTQRYNKPDITHVSSIKVNISQDASIEHVSNSYELSDFVKNAGKDMASDNYRK